MLNVEQHNVVGQRLRLHLSRFRLLAHVAHVVTAYQSTNELDYVLVQAQCLHEYLSALTLQEELYYQFLTTQIHPLQSTTKQVQYLLLHQ